MIYSAPCPLSKFLKTWKADEVKGIFPHGYYNTIEDLNTVSFPPKSAFSDNIKKKEVDDDLYEKVKSDYIRRLNLPDTDQNKFKSMKCYLKHYNLLGYFCLSLTDYSIFFKIAVLLSKQ